MGFSIVDLITRYDPSHSLCNGVFHHSVEVSRAHTEDQYSENKGQKARSSCLCGHQTANMLIGNNIIQCCASSHLGNPTTKRRSNSATRVSGMQLIKGASIGVPEFQ